MKRLPIFMSFVLFLFICFPLTAKALMLSLVPDSTEVIVGETFDVDVVIAGLDSYGGPTPTGADLGGYQFIIDYDMSSLDFITYTLGEQLGFSIDASFGDLGNGRVDLFEDSLEPDLGFQPDTFSLATLTFEASGVGISNFSLSNTILSDTWGEELFLDSTASASITVKSAPVPEPGSMLLFGTGLVGLAGIYRRTRKLL